MWRKIWPEVAPSIRPAWRQSEGRALSPAAQITVTHGVNCQTFTNITAIMAEVGLLSQLMLGMPRKLSR